MCKALCGAGRAKPVLADIPFLGQAWIPLLAAPVCEEADGNGDARLPLVTGGENVFACHVLPCGVAAKSCRNEEEMSPQYLSRWSLPRPLALFNGQALFGGCGCRGMWGAGPALQQRTIEPLKSLRQHIPTPPPRGQWVASSHQAGKLSVTAFESRLPIKRGPCLRTWQGFSGEF